MMMTTVEGPAARQFGQVRLQPGSTARFDGMGGPYYRETKNNFQPYIDDTYNKHWDPRSFKWDSDVRTNLMDNINGLAPDKFLKVVTLCAPLLKSIPAADRARLEKGNIPTDPEQLKRLKEAIVDRQFVGLRQITNHALVAEQAAVAPLSTGILDYRRYPVLQEAITTFVRDEAKHSGVFKRYLEEKMGGKIDPDTSTLRAFEMYMKMARRMPGAAVFLALAVETVGGAFFEFYAKQAPDPLFREMCDNIAFKDEQRHMALCRDLYNEFFRKQSRWEKFRNKILMKAISKQIYKEQARKEHYFMETCQSFGIPPGDLLKYITRRVEQEFDKIGHKIDRKQIAEEPI